MRIVIDIFLILFTIGFWLFASDSVSGAPTTLITYYFADFDSSTTGTVIRSRVRTGQHGAAFYDIKYGYFVSEKYYTSDQVDFSEHSSSDAWDMVRKYPKGKEVTVYYDQSRPMLSVLETTPLNLSVWGQIIAALLISIISITLLPLTGIKETMRHRALRRALRRVP